jgi:hypothetical protein
MDGGGKSQPRAYGTSRVATSQTPLSAPSPGSLVLNHSRHLEHFVAAVAAATLGLLLSAATANADMLPKRGQSFRFRYDIPPVAVSGGTVLVCQDAACTSSKSLDEYPWHPWFRCTADGCSGYGVPGPYNKLVITFADRVRESNVVAQPGESQFLVAVKADRLDASWAPTWRLFGFWDFVLFPLALLVVLAIELTVAYVYFRLTRTPRLLREVAAANVLTLFVVWFPLRLLDLTTAGYAIVAETFAVVCEAAILYYAGRAKGFAPKHAAALSLLMNAASFLIGLRLDFFAFIR